MTYPVLPEFQGIPQEYQHATWVPDTRYQGGGYYAGYGLGQHYTYAQLERLWLDAGGTMQEAPYMAYIAENVESGGDAGDWNSSGATGLWQIEWPSNYGGKREDLFTPIVNAETAVRMYKARGYQPWSGDNPKNLGIPPASTVPNERKAVPGGSAIAATDTSFPGSGILGGAGSGVLGVILGGSGGWQDKVERLGLILLGGALILIGVWMLAGKAATKVAVTAVAPEASAASSAVKAGHHASESQG